MKKYNYVYLITNKLNGKIYVGKHSTNNLEDRYMGSGKLIHKAINKYGLENFTKLYLAFTDSKESLDFLEKFYIKKYKARERGYNLTDGGDGTLGTHRDLRGSKNPLYGKHRTEETKKKLSIAAKKQCKNGSPFKGKHHTEKSKELMRIAAKNRKPMSEEHKRKIGTANKGKFLSEEHKRKIGAANLGHQMPYYKWLTENNEIKIMTKANVTKWHKNWKMIEKL